MENPLISIVIPIYGVENYISKCAQSLLEQTYDNIEYLFINDCSKDNSIEILKNVLSNNKVRNVRIITHSRNRGLSAARNTGVENASGDYILHVDADDWVKPDYVEIMISEALKSNADIVICGYERVYPDNILKILPPHLDKTELIKKILFNQIPGSMWGKLLKTTLYKDHTDTWAIEGINHGEDYATMPRLLYYANKISYVDNELYCYNLTNQNSYIHNISSKTVDSVLSADDVLVNFFEDKLDKKIIEAIRIRTKSAFIKTGEYVIYEYLSKIYNNLSLNNPYITKVDKILIRCLGHGIDRIIAKVVKRFNRRY